MQDLFQINYMVVNMVANMVANMVVNVYFVGMHSYPGM